MGGQGKEESSLSSRIESLSLPSYFLSFFSRACLPAIEARSLTPRLQSSFRNLILEFQLRNCVVEVAFGSIPKFEDLVETQTCVRVPLIIFYCRIILLKQERRESIDLTKCFSTSVVLCLSQAVGKRLKTVGQKTQLGSQSSRNLLFKMPASRPLIFACLIFPNWLRFCG